MQRQDDNRADEGVALRIEVAGRTLGHVRRRLRVVPHSLDAAPAGGAGGPPPPGADGGVGGAGWGRITPATILRWRGRGSTIGGRVFRPRPARPCRARRGGWRTSLRADFRYAPIAPPKKWPSSWRWPVRCRRAPIR